MGVSWVFSKLMGVHELASYSEPPILMPLIFIFIPRGQVASSLILAKARSPHNKQKHWDLRLHRTLHGCSKYLHSLMLQRLI